ncbi:eCIS core domain-containing protein [Streptomyces sp. CPS1]
MRSRDNARAEEAENSRPPVRTPAVPAGTPLPPLLTFQRGAGNAAVVQMLRLAGHFDAASEQADQAVQRSAVHDVLRSPGRPLDGGTRAEMEARLGADFSDVRIHTGSAARDSAAEIGARAYTSREHVVLGDGCGDKHTLAHELTHVIQQRQGPVAGTDDGTGLKVSDPGDRFEREAEANASRVMSVPVARAAEASVRASEPGRAHARATDRPDVQRAGDRSKNPHADSGGEHNDWELTAHHIVPHTALKNALEQLSEEDRTDVLIAAVPSKISKDMLRRLGLSEEQCKRINPRTIQQALLDRGKGGEEIVPGTTYDEMRLAFFEWQGGNQFLGPNTSIRAEPSDSKDGIDVDGKYFLPPGAGDLKQQFSRVVSLGDGLKKSLRNGAESKEIADILKDLLSLTKDVVPAAFDPKGWVEITDPKRVQELAGSKDLGRSHLAKYSFFKFGTANIEQECPMLVKKEDGFHVQGVTDKGGSGWRPYYEGAPTKKIDQKYLQIKGQSTYVNMDKIGKDFPDLYDFCVQNSLPTSTYLPRSLCATLGIE